MSDNLITIATYSEPIQANIARSALEAAGLLVNLRGETANSLFSPGFSAELQVRAEDVDTATAILNAAPESEAEVTAAELAQEHGD